MVFVLPRRYRSSLPPLVLILAFSAGCESEKARSERLALEARNREAETQLARREAEREKPSAAVLGQVRSAAEAFMADQHPQEAVDELVFTQLTPNLYLLGAKLKSPADGRRDLTAERLRSGKDQEFYWVIEDASPARMAELAKRHGFAREVEQVAAQATAQDWGDVGGGGEWDQTGATQARGSVGTHSTVHPASWLGPILLWHYLYNRPSPMGFSYRNPQQGFHGFTPGYRYTTPQRPFTPAVRDRLGAIPAQTGGHSAVFLGGTAWQPRAMADHPGLNSAKIYAASPGGGAAARVVPGAVSRGGFGATGRSTTTPGAGRSASGSHSGAGSSGS